ncbi:hypothetical protein PHYSODRAFT_286323 [Phytophthora sojae]|uniref:RxLR effector protein n=2 Tax=Phytophthora sojae TaxID=67593 RepID=G4ZPB0_PHYSP|nr:hypothetical protein PHYSODRAFT_286323 [Phytophthora sojae]AEK80663.1 Avh99 [Phytophthora sojae]AEK80664.1 Avh99 [Phytophthora sojae]AEK80665.1 Avh99 [Phytophthora sojae]EGZ15444.1 hypothetical protein PHYSODRAFT_286323 [Phytophthora sojae]|eukprot:XP_009529193.1 hypothetical protein PHYSODRAFT_286323 [Phytophthora sojae]
MRLTEFSLLLVAILMACCATLASSTNAITALGSRPNIAPAGAGGSVQRSLRRSNSTVRIEGDTDEERGVWTRLKGMAKKLSFGSKRLQKSSSALKTSENAIVQQAEAVLMR